MRARSDGNATRVVLQTPLKHEKIVVFTAYTEAVYADDIIPMKTRKPGFTAG